MKRNCLNFCLLISMLLFFAEPAIPGFAKDPARKERRKQEREQRKREREQKREQKRKAKKKPEKPSPPGKTSKKTPGKQEEKKERKKDDPRNFSAPPMRRNSEGARPEGTCPCIEKTFRMQTGIAEEPEVNVTCLIPVGADGKPTEGAKDMVFYSPFAGARAALKKRPELRRYANALGMSIFTLEITTDVKYLEDPKHYYCYKESGWHEAALKAHDLVLKETGLERRKLLILGDSVGGSYAQQIATRYPERVDAVAFAGGRRFAEAVPNRISWLILSTWECPGMQNSRNLAERYREMGGNVLRGETPPVLPDSPAQFLFHHTPSRIAYEILEDYLAGIRDLRTKHGGVIPPDTEWPVQKTFFGCELNFPSKQCADSWAKLPGHLREETELGDSSPLFLSAGTKDRKSPLAVYIQDPSVRNTILEDTLCFLALQGADTFGLRAGASDADCQELCRTVRRMFPGRKYYLIGAGSSGLRLLEAALKCGLPAQKITLLDTDTGELTEKLSPWKRKIGRLNVCLLSLRGTGDPEEAFSGIKYVLWKNPQPEFGSAWFQAVQRGICDEE